MIQRVQTIYLLLVALLTGLTTAFDIALFKLEEKVIYSYSIYKISDHVGNENIVPGNWIPQIVLVTAIVILSIFTITRFKNRKSQLKLGAISYLLLTALIISTYFTVENLTNILKNGENLTTLYYIGFFLPIAAVTFQVLANSGIKKEEELVKSVERLR